MTELLGKFATWGVLLSIAAYGLGLYIQRKTRRPWLHPLLLSSILIIVLLSGLRVPYPDFKASASPVAYLLLPATVRRSKRNERSVSAYPTRMATHPFELKPIIKTSKRQ